MEAPTDALLFRHGHRQLEFALDLGSPQLDPWTSWFDQNRLFPVESRRDPANPDLLLWSDLRQRLGGATYPEPEHRRIRIIGFDKDMLVERVEDRFLDHRHLDRHRLSRFQFGFIAGKLETTAGLADAGELQWSIADILDGEDRGAGFISIEFS